MASSTLVAMSDSQLWMSTVNTKNTTGHPHTATLCCNPLSESKTDCRWIFRELREKRSWDSFSKIRRNRWAHHDFGIGNWKCARNYKNIAHIRLVVAKPATIFFWHPGCRNSVLRTSKNKTYPPKRKSSQRASRAFSIVFHPSSFSPSPSFFCQRHPPLLFPFSLHSSSMMRL